MIPCARQLSLILFMSVPLGSGAAAQGWDLELQGGFLKRQQYSPPTAAERVDIGANPIALGTESIVARDNWTGRIALRHRLSERVDIGVAFTGIAGLSHDQTFTSSIPVVLIFPGLISSPISSAVGGTEIQAQTRVNQYIVDLDLGFHPIADPSLKVLAGVRFTHFAQFTKLTLPTAFFPVNSEFGLRRKDEFIGAGPRIGVRWSFALTHSLSLHAAGSGSIVFGQQRFRSSVVGFDGVATGSFDDAHARVAYNGEGELSLAYNLMPGTYLAIGYQASAWFGIRDNRRELDAAATIAANPNPTVLLPGGQRRPIDLAHGPLVRFGVRW